MGNGPNGRPLRKFVSAKSRSEVAQKLKVLQRQIDDGLLPRGGHVALSALLDRWFADIMRHQVAPSTLVHYQSIATTHIVPSLGTKKLIDLSVSAVDRLLSLKGDSGLSSSTVRRIRTVLAQCLDQAIRWGLLFRNVARLSRSPKSVRKDGEPSRPIRRATFSAHSRATATRRSTPSCSPRDFAEVRPWV
jgi:integrase